MTLRRLIVFVCVSTCSVTSARAQSFFTNYLKPEYLVPVSDFPATAGGDLVTSYYQVQMPVMKGAELLVVGEFPRARFFSITAYDDHGAIIGVLNDKDIIPLNSSNPYQVGGPTGAEDVFYALTIRLDNAMAVAPASSCDPSLDVHQNVLDARSRHTAGTYYSSQQSNFSANVAGYGTVTHVDATTNTGMFLIIRSTMLQNPTSSSQVDLRRPLVWVRSAATGCAVQLTTPGQYLPASQWYSLNSIVLLDQAYAHIQHEVDLGTTSPFGSDPVGEAPWFGREEYLPGQAVGRYVAAVIPLSATTLNNQARVMEMQFRLPQLCRTSVPCPLTGTEQLRHWSLTFEDSGGRSIGTIVDLSFTPDQNGYVTFVLSFGTALPSYVTPASGYARLTVPNWPVYRAVIRNTLPAPTFLCSTNNVPPRTSEYQPNGGYMGEYVPVITFPAASSLPTVAQPLVSSGSCQYP